MAANMPISGSVPGSFPTVRGPGTISAEPQEKLQSLLQEKDELIAKLQAELGAANAEIERLKLASMVPQRDLTARERQSLEMLRKENLDLKKQRVELLTKSETSAHEVSQLKAKLAGYEKQQKP